MGYARKDQEYRREMSVIQVRCTILLTRMNDAARIWKQGRVPVIYRRARRPAGRPGDTIASVPAWALTTE
jgi:hypothetical protein